MSSARETVAPPLKSCGVRRSRSPSNCVEKWVEEKCDEERSRAPYPYLSLDQGIDVGRAVLEELVGMASFAL